MVLLCTHPCNSPIRDRCIKRFQEEKGLHTNKRALQKKHLPYSGIIAGGGKETGGAQLKRVESLESELGIRYTWMETQGHKIQHQADSMASLELKMDRRFEEVLNVIARNKREEPGGKKTMPVGPNNEPRSTTVETPRVVGIGSNGGSRNNTESGDGPGGGSTEGDDSGGRPNGSNYGTSSSWRF
ncbi:unnamed protein product [Lactuca virosa]|uniref:Uncharacterized protein n=1 Tax=Lactuca virosa TaxID=75947 RepID=A0AAU9P7M7_9ASTR|nr:unnamed protein product [Lactuca virosa]